MKTVTVHQAKTNLSELLRNVEAGEEIIIARGNKPVAVLKEFTGDEMAKRRAAALGSDVGRYAPVPDDVFFGPMPDEDFIEMFGQDFFDLHREAK